MMLARYFFVFCFLLLYVDCLAQEKPARSVPKIKHNQGYAMYDSLPDAKSQVLRMIDNYQENTYKKHTSFNYNVYQKTSVEVVFHKDSLKSRVLQFANSNDFISNYLIRPFAFCLDYVRPEKDSDLERATVLLYEDYQSVYSSPMESNNPKTVQVSSDNGIFQVIGHKNILSFLDEGFGNIDLFNDRNDIMLLSFKSPLSYKYSDIYTYRLMKNENMEDKDISCIVFYCENMKENAFCGYLYVTTDDTPRLLRAEFTFNNPGSTNFLKNIYIKHEYSQKENTIALDSKESKILLGSENKGQIVATRQELYTDYNFTVLSEEKKKEISNLRKITGNNPYFWQEVRPIPLTNSQILVDSLRLAADKNRRFSKMESLILLALNGTYSFGGVNAKAEIGPLTHLMSYNQMEGLRLRVGANTTINLSKHFQLGGYTAYGTKDQRVKYQANLAYSFLPKSKYIWEYPKKIVSVSFASDLNIPGQDLLLMNRDHFSQSFSHTPTDNMSLQQIGLISFESENKHNFSYKVTGKYTYDRPMGVVKYMQTDGNGDTTIVNNITSSELQFSLRFAPGEKFIQRKEKRTAIRRASFELDFTHRIGLKGVLHSGYSYQASVLNLFKRFSLDKNAGVVDVYLSAGKIWGTVPFPLLFIPEGNQSYMFNSKTYNCMDFYEFVTDRFASTSINTCFNWSPVRLVLKNDQTKICLGTKVLYGPLSQKNNPASDPRLFVLNNGITPLENTPYCEVNIGIANIFKVLRVDYSRRLTYLSGRQSTITKGTILFSGSFSF